MLIAPVWKELLLRMLLLLSEKLLKLRLKFFCRIPFFDSPNLLSMRFKFKLCCWELLKLVIEFFMIVISFQKHAIYVQ